MRLLPKAVDRIPGLALAAVLAAVLAAAPAVARAGEEPPVLLPDMGAEGAAAADADSVPGADAEGTAAGEAARVDGGTVPPGAAAESRDATGGSRLLKALADSPSPGTVAAPGAALPFAAEACPRALLRRLLAGAASEADALTALAIEQEVLTLCRERQEIVAGLFETEARLRELRAPEEPAVPAEGPPAETASVEAPTPAAARAIEPQPSPLRTALAAAAETQAEPPAPAYGWFSIIGVANALRAGVTDGTGVWFVREGDRLPGGARVAAIAGRPPAVRVSGTGGDGQETPLPYRARPGGGP